MALRRVGHQAHHKQHGQQERRRRQYEAGQEASANGRAMQLLDDRIQRCQRRREQERTESGERRPRRHCSCGYGENTREYPCRIADSSQGAAHDLHTENTPLAVRGDGEAAA